MLAIRMQRTGRKGHAMFRVVVQESRLAPTSGKVVANLGSYDPHAKVSTVDKEKAAFYLEHGAQPSDRVVRLLQSEGLTMPKWVTINEGKQGKLRKPEKQLRKNQPKEEQVVEQAPKPESPSTETAAETEPKEEA